jgi:hypothetical protein
MAQKMRPRRAEPDYGHGEHAREAAVAGGRPR